MARRGLSDSWHGELPKLFRDTGGVQMQWKENKPQQDITFRTGRHGRDYDVVFSLHNGYKLFSLSLIAPSKDSIAIQKATWPMAAIAKARRALDEIEEELQNEKH